MVGAVVRIGVLLMAIEQALRNIGMETWSNYVAAFLGYALTHAAVALVIVLVGLVIGNAVGDMLRAGNEDDRGRGWMAEIARYAVLVFAITMAVSHLDVAQDFVLIAFSLLFGSLCLAVALAAGLGSKDVVGQLVSEHVAKVREAPAAEAPEETAAG